MWNCEMKKGFSLLQIGILVNLNKVKECIVKWTLGIYISLGVGVGIWFDYIYLFFINFSQTKKTVLVLVLVCVCVYTL